MQNLMIFILLIVSVNINYSQEFYTLLGKSESTLINNYGAANSIKTVGAIKVYQYFNGTNENTVFSIKSNIVVMAINSHKCYSVSSAKNKSNALILYYINLGFTKQGNSNGMTLLKKGKRELSIGYMDNNDGTYSAMVTAF